MTYFHCGMVSAPEIWTGTPSKFILYLQIICCNSGISCFSCQRPETSRERPQRIIALRACEIPATSRISFTFWTAFAANFRKSAFLDSSAYLTMPRLAAQHWNTHLP